MQMFGCSREQIIGKSPFQFSPRQQPDGRISEEKGKEKLEGVFGGTEQFFEWQHSRLDGSLFDAEVTLNKIEIAGEPHLLAHVRDITDRKSAEKQLHVVRRFELAERFWVDLRDQLSGLKIPDTHGTVKVGKCDVDSNRDSAMEYGVMNIPTLILFKNGEPVERFQGVQPKAKLQEAIDAAKA